MYVNFSVLCYPLIVLYHQLINSDTQANSSIKIAVLKHIHKVVCSDKEGNLFYILETVLMTYTSNIDIGFCGSF